MDESEPAFMSDDEDHVAPIITPVSMLWRRLQATLLDHTWAGLIMLLPAIMLLVTTQNVFLSIGIGILFIAFIFALIEASKRRASSGLFLMGLHLKKARFVQLWLRNLLKFLPSMCILILLFALLLGEQWEPTFAAIFAGCLLIEVYNLSRLARGQEPLHNQLTGNKIEVMPIKPSYGRLYVSMCVWGALGGGGVLAILPNTVGSCGRAPISSVKSNMHTFQTIAETYAVDWGGRYAPSVQVLKQEADNGKNAYWKEFANPMTGYSGVGKSYSNEWETKSEGFITYEPIGPQFTKYFIYGYDKKGQRIQNKGKDFFLTNS